MKEFDLTVCMERYLKRLALLSAEVARRPREPQQIPLEAALRYPPTARGSFVASKSVKKRVWDHAFARTAARLKPLPADQRSPNSENILAFSYLMMGHRDSDFDKLYWKLLPHSNTYAYFSKAVETLEAGVRRFPNDLLLRFNLGRLCYHTGRSERAYEVFGELAAATSVQFNPLLDLYGEDFGELNFTFRDYVDHLWRYLVTKEERWLERLSAIVMASAWHYRGLIELKWGDQARALKSFEKALRQHGHNACYHEQYANLLWTLSGRNPKARDLAVRHIGLAWDISPYCSGLLAKYAAWLHRSGDPTEAVQRLQAYDHLMGRIDGVTGSHAELRILAKARAELLEPALAGQ